MHTHRHHHHHRGCRHPAAQAADELLCPCSRDPKVKVVAEWMADYANKSAASMREFLAGHQASAAFMPACFDHTGDLCMKHGPTVVTPTYPAGIDYRTALSAWFFGRAHQGELILEHCPPGAGVTCNANCGGGCGDS